jgi:hypothetical protein
LIGTEKRIPEKDDAHKYILGWIPADYCYLIDNKLWIMPVRDAQNEKIEKKINPVLFVTSQQAMLFKENSLINSQYIVWQDSIKVQNGEWTSFPILEENGDIFRVKIIEDEFRTGYGCKQIKGFDYKLFTEVTLISSPVLQLIIDNLRKIIEQSASFDDLQTTKQEMVRIYKKKHDDLNGEIINSMSSREVIEDLFWCLKTEGSWLDLPFKTFDNPNFMTRENFQAFREAMINSEKELTKYQNKDFYDKNVNTFVSNNIRYFWIDIDMFP